MKNGAEAPFSHQRSAPGRPSPTQRPSPSKSPGSAVSTRCQAARVDAAAVPYVTGAREALAAGGAVTTADQSEFALASLLADWRDEIVTTPVPAGPTVDELLAATVIPMTKGRGS